jgi:predicted GTPase
VIVWDGGNNDSPFVAPDLHIVVTDALRPRDVDTHHPGEAVLRMADVVVVNKVDAAAEYDVVQLIAAVRRLNTRATIVKAASPVRLDDPERVARRSVVVVEDGPTLTHGGMPWGAGLRAALDVHAQVVDPHAFASPALARLYAQYPHIGPVVPAVGYDAEQLEALAATLRAAPCDVIVSASPFDLAARIAVDKPIVRARYGYAAAGEPALEDVVASFLAERVLAPEATLA